jgi:hypothetical protein
LVCLLNIQAEISFEGIKEVADFAKQNSTHTINYAAFYADCDHEVKPLMSGYRICLVYNLIQQKAGKKIELQSLQSHAGKLAKLFAKDADRNNNHPYIILLGHQYTPENFSNDALKLNDRAKAEALLLAAKQAGYYAKLCLVTSYISGAPAYSGGYGYDEDDDEDAEMDEIYDNSLSIEHWLKNELPALSNVHFEENELITSFPLNDDDPVVKESTGYMGNYGPDLMHWYHYGAVMIWSPRVNARLLLSQDTATQLNWIDYFNHAQQISEAEIAAVEVILSTGLNDNRRSDEKKNFNAVADWLIKRKEKTFLLQLNSERLQFFFNKIDIGHWMNIFRFLSTESTIKLFEKATEDITVTVLEKLLAIVKALVADKELKHFASEQTMLLPDYFKALDAKTQKRINADSLSDLFWISENMLPVKEWTTAIAGILTKNLQRQYVHTVLVPQLLAVKKQSALTSKLLQSCLEYLQRRADNQPKPPAN